MQWLMFLNPIAVEILLARLQYLEVHHRLRCHYHGSHHHHHHFFVGMHLPPHQHGDDYDVLLLLNSTTDDEMGHGEMTMQLQQYAALQGRRRCIGTRSSVGRWV
jgi:hypothetical protein